MSIAELFRRSSSAVFAVARFGRVERRAAEVQLLQQTIRCDTTCSRSKCVVVCRGVLLVCR